MCVPRVHRPIWNPRLERPTPQLDVPRPGDYRGCTMGVPRRGRKGPRRHASSRKVAEDGDTVKLVVYGPERRVGALAGDQVIDLNRAYTKYLKEKQGESRPAAMATAVVPADLAGLIASGPRALEGA